MDKTQGTELRRKVKVAIAEHVRVSLDLAELLHDVYHATVTHEGEEQELVHVWGFDSFHDWAELECGLHGGRATLYVRIHGLLVQKHGKAKLPKSISKMRDLCKVAAMAPEDVPEWIERADRMTCCEFEHEISKKYHDGGSKVSLGFRMGFRDGSRVRKGLREAQKKLSADTTGNTLATIVAEWLETNKSRKAPKLEKAS